VSQMLPPDMLAALGGAQPGAAPMDAPPMPPDGGGGGGLPPDMMAALGGGGAPPPEEAPPGALHGGSAAEGDPNSLVAEAIDLLEQAAKASPDDQQIQTILKCITQLQGTLATAEKQAAGGDVTPMLAADTSY
jgi:hypothetical protein